MSKPDLSKIIATPRLSILEKWDITPEELTLLVETNGSLRGMMLGYVAELQLTKKFLSISEHISYSVKADDHDRGNKGDRQIIYKGVKMIIESKSLKTNSIKRIKGNDGEYWSGKAQVDASDCRNVRLPDGSDIETTCLRRGEFDILAVNCFAFDQKWNFAFALNKDLPGTTWRKYREAQRKHLLATLVNVTWPPRPPFQADLVSLLEGIARERRR